VALLIPHVKRETLQVSFIRHQSHTPIINSFFYKLHFLSLITLKLCLLPPQHHLFYILLWNKIFHSSGFHNKSGSVCFFCSSLFYLLLLNKMDDYEIVEKLGRGALGATFLVLHKTDRKR
jgi:hypothetical protein